MLSSPRQRSGETYSCSSAPAHRQLPDLPTWRALVEQLLEHRLATQASAAVIREVTEYRDRGQLIDALSALEHQLGAAEFGAAVERLLRDEDVPVPPLASTLAKLAPHVRAVLTTNIDRLLERAFPSAWKPVVGVLPDLAQRERCIVKLHGDLIDRRSWVLTRAQYDKAMFNDPMYRSTFASMLSSRTVLFVGFGMVDDDLELVLEPMRALAQGQAPRHIAMMATGTVAPYRAAKLSQAGVSLLHYENSDGAHQELRALLDQLAIRLAAAPLADTSPAPKNPTKPFPLIPNVSDAANALLREPPFAWEQKFFNRVLQDEFANAAELKHDLDVGLAPLAAVPMSVVELLGWAGTQFGVLGKVSANLERLVNCAVPDAMGPLGSPGDPVKLAHAARRIGQCYKNLASPRVLALYGVGQLAG